MLKIPLIAESFYQQTIGNFRHESTFQLLAHMLHEYSRCLCEHLLAWGAGILRNADCGMLKVVKG